MPNHVHLILMPGGQDGLRRALAAVHRRYAGHIHTRLKRTGHFWQGRFGCAAMDEAHLGAALRYVALNPVRARLVERAADWPWSSIHAHLGHRADDGLTAVAPVLERYPDFRALIEAGEEDEAFSRLRKAEPIDRPVGGPALSKHWSAKAAGPLRPLSAVERLLKVHCHRYSKDLKAAICHRDPLVNIQQSSDGKA